jgi:erythromycin esterase-like protein
MRGESAMMQKYGYGFQTHRGVARALHEWFAALDAANESVEAEIYACAADLVIEWLQSENTFDGLFCAFSSPGMELTRLVTVLCTEGEILLQPHLLMGASCALRLRQLMTFATKA